jgi:hypothetical protein
VSPYEVIREVEAAGGTLELEGRELTISAPQPLTPNLVESVRANKPAIMVALGAPFDLTTASMLHDLRPHLPAVMRRLPDDRLLALVNWHVIAAWGASMNELGKRSIADVVGRAPAG